MEEEQSNEDGAEYFERGGAGVNQANSACGNNSDREDEHDCSEPYADLDPPSGPPVTV